MRHLLSRKHENFNFPPSLIFIAPPTKDSNRYQLRVDSQLLLLNSYNPLSPADNDSVAVVSYERLLVEHLGVLTALPLQDAWHVSAREVETTKAEILETLRYLDRKKGDEWNKQLCAQLNPNTFIISGEDQLTS